MATLHLILDKRRAKKDGTYPLVFRVRLQDKFCDIGTGFSIRKEQFDSKTSTILDDLQTNQQLDDLKLHYVNRMRKYLVSNVGKENIQELRSYLVNKLPDEVTIIEFWKKHIASLRIAKRYGGAKTYQTALGVLSLEINLNVPFHRFTYGELIQLESNLFQRGLSVNSVGVYFRSFRAICNQAIKHDLVDYEWYPFRKYRFRREKTTPRTLSMEEMKAYFRLKLSKNDPLYTSWQLGKLIFMLRGINITDLLLLTNENIKGNRIIYNRAKTGKIYSIHLQDDIREVFNVLANDGKTMTGILSDQELKSPSRLIEVINMRRKVVNAHLKRIGTLVGTKEPITTYVFRYSYSNIAKQLGFSKDLIAEALGHEYGNSVTGIYLEQFDNSVVDSMNLKIIREVGGVH